MHLGSSVVDLDGTVYKMIMSARKGDGARCWMTCHCRSSPDGHLAKPIGVYQNQPFLAGGGGAPAMTHLMFCWNSRSYVFVLGLKMSHWTGFGMPICATSVGSCVRNRISSRSWSMPWPRKLEGRTWELSHRRLNLQTRW